MLIVFFSSVCLWYIGSLCCLWAAWAVVWLFKLAGISVSRACVVECLGIAAVRWLFALFLFCVYFFCCRAHTELRVYYCCFVVLFLPLATSAALAKVEHYGTTIQVERTPVGISITPFVHFYLIPIVFIKIYLFFSFHYQNKFICCTKLIYIDVTNIDCNHHRQMCENSLFA